MRRWRSRDTQHAASHTPHHLPTILTPAQEAVVVELCRMLELSLDDLLVVVREFVNTKMSRSGMDRCLRRHGVKTFKDYAHGFVTWTSNTCRRLADESRRRYLFVAIDRALGLSRTVFRPVATNRLPLPRRRAARAKAPFRITKLLTANDGTFTDYFTQPRKQPSGTHPFDRLSAEQGIIHRRAPPRHPQTNGMIQRLIGRISDVLASTRFRSRDDLETTPRRYAILYNQHVPQKALNHKTPVDALRNWQQRQPELLVGAVRKHRGPDWPK